MPASAIRSGIVVEVVLERLGVRVRVHEEKPAPRLEPERDEAELVLRDPALLVSVAAP